MSAVEKVRVSLAAAVDVDNIDYHVQYPYSAAYKLYCVYNEVYTSCTVRILLHTSCIVYILRCILLIMR